LAQNAGIVFSKEQIYVKFGKDLRRQEIQAVE
jgi:hypothetical protein